MIIKLIVNLTHHSHLWTSCHETAGTSLVYPANQITPSNMSCILLASHYYINVEEEGSCRPRSNPPPGTELLQRSKINQPNLFALKLISLKKATWFELSMFHFGYWKYMRSQPAFASQIKDGLSICVAQNTWKRRRSSPSHVCSCLRSSLFSLAFTGRSWRSCVFASLKTTGPADWEDVHLWTHPLLWPEPQTTRPPKDLLLQPIGAAQFTS